MAGGAARMIGGVIVRNGDSMAGGGRSRTGAESLKRDLNFEWNDE